MVAQNLLFNTASLYSNKAQNDSRYAYPRDVLEGVIKQLKMTTLATGCRIKNSEQFIVLKTTAHEGKQQLIRHPIDFHESTIKLGIEALKKSGMLDEPHVCMIAVSASSLNGVFTYIYEIVRRCGWSVLPLGGSEDGADISYLSKNFSVDTIFLPPTIVDSVFSREMADKFNTLRNILCIGEVPSPALVERMRIDFPHIRFRPFVYSPNDTGPIGIPNVEGCEGTYDVPENILLEVESVEGDVALNGSGKILVSVLGLEDPDLIRWRIDDIGTLKTDEAGKQLIEIQPRVYPG
ncbi:MAG: hypothetical protein PHD48_00845 [Alphaproteobacteria bacterium]|nr:hypothetical protein [Alphaproteobacteria bacterium]